jgi:putative Ca2+/H+ antiporter (TMEM165/GDT1 family)
MAAASTLVSTFVLVFVAEWGDKSFFSTIGMKYYLYITMPLQANLHSFCCKMH